jgi:hypothetical protein
MERFDMLPTKSSILLLTTWWAAMLCSESVLGQPFEYEMAIRYVGEYPANAEPNFSTNVQGVAQDGNHWYITQTTDLWKFPIAMPWGDVDGNPPTAHTQLSDYVNGPPYVHSDFNHMGDLTYHNFCGIGVLIVPLHGENRHNSGLLVIDASDLSGIGYREFDPNTHGLAGWCAIDEQGIIYTTGDGHSKIKGYGLDCGELAAGRVVFTFAAERNLLDEDGVPLERHHKQGGVFSPSGELFVLSTGYGTENSDPVLDGIHVFDASGDGTSWRRIAHSTNGYGLFNFQWDPEWPKLEEPEGMTWLDLDDLSVPGMAGQLHILMLDNDTPGDPDDIYFKHYTHRIHVDAASSGGNGTIGDPYPTVGEADALTWDGAEFRIQAGVYDEALTIGRRVRLTSQGGVAHIGG